MKRDHIRTMKRITRVIIIVFGLTVVVYFFGYKGHLRALAAIDSMTKGSPRRPSWQKVTKAKSWVLTSYTRAGSTFVGQLLGHRRDTFYWIEPLNPYQVYFIGKKSCDDEFGKENCITPEEDDTKLDDAVRDVDDIFRCDFFNLGHLVHPSAMSLQSGANWHGFDRCATDQQEVQKCLKQQAAQCSRAKHRGIKMLRMSPGNLLYVLNSNPNVKVIHLFRDPRAIMNSRIANGWYGVTDLTSDDKHAHIMYDASELCDRMHQDIKASVILRQHFPTRYGVVLFEDLLSNLETKARFLYQFFGINTEKLNLGSRKIDNLGSKLDTTGMSPNISYSNWWRVKLETGLVREINSVCTDVMSYLGYVPLVDHRSLQSLAISSSAFSKELMLEHLGTKMQYRSLE